MTILHFAAHQNDVFLPALTALLVVAVAVALPIVFAPTLRRSRRLVPVVAAAVVVAVVALTVAAWQAGVGFRTLADERARVGQELATRYGLDLTGAEVGELVDGGIPEPKGVGKIRLVAQSPDGDVYDVRVHGQVVQPTG